MTYLQVHTDIIIRISYIRALYYNIMNSVRRCIIYIITSTKDLIFSLGRVDSPPPTCACVRACAPSPRTRVTRLMEPFLPVEDVRYTYTIQCTVSAYHVHMYTEPVYWRRFPPRVHWVGTPRVWCLQCHRRPKVLGNIYYYAVPNIAATTTCENDRYTKYYIILPCAT